MDVYSFGFIIKGCCEVGDLMKGFRLVTMLEAFGLSPNVVIYTTLIDGCCKNGDVMLAKKLFCKMDRLGVVANQHTYSVLMNGFFKQGLQMEGFQMYQNMKQSGIVPNVYAYNCVISEYCNGGMVDKAFKHHQGHLRAARGHHRSNHLHRATASAAATSITVATATTVVLVRRRSTNAVTVTITTARRSASNGHHRVTFFTLSSSTERDYYRVLGVPEYASQDEIKKAFPLMDERACFPPGMIALGSFGYTTDDESQKFLSLAEELAWTCYNFYQSTPTKLAGKNSNTYPKNGESASTKSTFAVQFLNL
ncbi:hypothetical protein ACSQ67_006151 [Phaseolus vulgaris]